MQALERMDPQLHKVIRLSQDASSIYLQCNQRWHTGGSAAVGVGSNQLGTDRSRMSHGWLLGSGSSAVECSHQGHRGDSGAGGA
jgi:hypothetical protein